MEGRFTRLFPDLPGARFDQTDLKLLARAMTAPPEESAPETEEDPEENPAYRRPTPISDSSSTMTSPSTPPPACVSP